MMKRLCVLFILLFALLFCSEGFAADVLKKGDVAAAPKLLSKSAKPLAADVTQPVVIKEKKKKFELPDPDPTLVKLNVPVKSTQGVVTGRNNYGVAVEYASDAKKGGQEIWFSYSSGIKMHGIKKLSELAEGDKVEVKYKEAADKRKLVLEVTLVSKKPPEPVEPPAPAALKPKELL